MSQETTYVGAEYRILKRPLRLTEIRRLVREIRKSSDISAYSVIDWLCCKNIFAAQDHQGQLLGACFNDDFFYKWTEIAVLFVFEEHRQKSLCTKLLEASIRDIKVRNRNIIIMTKNPYVKNLIHKSGFEIFPDLKKNSRLNRKNRFILTSYYTVRWLFNIYRIMELIRKRIVFGPREPYEYGLIINLNSK